MTGSRPRFGFRNQHRKREAVMKITAISDLHGYIPILSGGDILVVAGDVTARDEVNEWHTFFQWLAAQKYSKKVLIGGNHDNFLENTNILEESYIKSLLEDNIFEYLLDSGFEFEGIKFWGSPWSAKFYGQNPECAAFSFKSRYQMEEKWNLIPNDIDILITHTPPFGILDYTSNSQRVGCMMLDNAIKSRLNNLKIHIFGHIHEAYGVQRDEPPSNRLYINASQVDARYRNVNKPVDIILEDKRTTIC